MIPDVPNVLGGIARALMFDLGPEVTSPYGSLTIQLGAGLLAMIAQESDRAAARLTAENDAIVALFATAERLIDGSLKEELAGCRQGSGDESLLVSDLRRRNRELRAVLIGLHAFLEESGDPRARSMEELIWNELVESTRRRQLDLAIG